ncbi:hypothetical protein RchiOBHm_Chr7g0232701 [Rosa chinensis]|uniref:Uncharacterized protein n=1 Tax=Rosa chinensis TaxID=74649 RepID=A0A2P6PG36_ROSCH|nr:hypothetical protein RchiOBHm_Chr7g0232701 [Rosa chinensis]
MPTLLNEIWNPNPNLKCPLFSLKGLMPQASYVPRCMESNTFGI